MVDSRARGDPRPGWCALVRIEEMIGGGVMMRISRWLAVTVIGRAVASLGMKVSSPEYRAVMV